MIINRDNYETFFLLYIDNELSAAEREAVEAFTAQHPDLQEELRRLQDVILPEDDIFFDSKVELLKPENMQEKLLLHLDNELKAPSVDELKRSIAANVVLQKEWETLQQTKLDSNEQIIFTEKHLLYRRSNNVVTGRFVRWAAAAILIGIGFFVGVSINNKQTSIEGTFATESTTKTNSKTVVQKGNDRTDEKNNTGTTTNNDATTDPSTTVNTATKQEIASKEKIQPKENNSNGRREEMIKVQDKISEENLIADVPKKTLDNNIVLPSNKTNQEIKPLSPEREFTGLAVNGPKKKPEIVDVNILEKETNTLASMANHKENDDQILYMNEEDISKSKAGGFFRKLKRTVERKTKIKTGNNLKIAGFEIALN